MKVKCESCLSAEAIQPQIFVVATAPDPTVKFEETTGTQTQSTLGKVYPQLYLIDYFNLVRAVVSKACPYITIERAAKVS